MFGKHTTEALVVGAGPVGLYTAIELADRGIEVEIIDGQWRTAAHSYALALHPSTLELLDRMELADELLESGHRIDTVAFYDGAERRAELELSRLPGKYPFVLVLPQRALEEAFERRLADRRVKIKWSHRLTGIDLNGKQATAAIDKLGKEASGYAFSSTGWVVDKTLKTRADFIVGADGLHSAVRRALGIDFTEVGARRFFGVFELNAEMETANEVRVVLDEDTTNVLWPMRDNHFRWSFELDDAWEQVPRSRTKSRLTVQVGEATFPFLSEDKLAQLLAERAPWFDAELGEITWSVAVRFEHRLAERFGRGNVWLAGDSAHVTAPVGIQSMNNGSQEGHELAGAIGGILRGKLSGELLESYGRTRRDEWRKLLGLENSLEVGADADRWVASRYDRILSCIPASGNDLRRMLRQLDVELAA